MAAVTGYKGFVTSWAIPNDTTISLFSPMAFSVQVTAEAYDSTEFVAGSASAVVRQRVKGLREWTAELEGYAASPTAGHLGNLTGTNIYATNPKSWEVNIKAAELPTTGFQPSGDWRTFVAGLVEWTLDYECYVDSSTGLTMPDAAPGTVCSFTATISSGNTLDGTVVVTGCNVDEKVGDVAVVRYSCVGTGHLRTIGSANILPANSGAMTIPAASDITLKTYDDASDKTLVGSAFWTNMRVRAAPGEPVQFNASLRGTGALTST